MILSPSTTLFLQKLVGMVGLGRYVDRSLSQSLPTLGTCQVLGMHLSGAGSCSACQVLVYAVLTVFVRCWVTGSSQCLSGAGIGINPRCTPRSGRVQYLSGTGMWQSVRCLSDTGNQGGVSFVVRGVISVIYCCVISC